MNEKIRDLVTKSRHKMVNKMSIEKDKKMVMDLIQADTVNINEVITRRTASHSYLGGDVDSSNSIGLENLMKSTELSGPSRIRSNRRIF